MNKNTNIIVVLSIVFAIAILVVGWLVYRPSSTPAGNLAGSPENATYTIEGQKVTLVDGVSEVAAAPGSATMISTRYFGNPVVSDLNGDGRPDTAFILTQNSGGSGTFYYVVAALNTPSGYIGSQGLLLGDRIAPQTTEMSQDPQTPSVVIVNYADRAPGESFTVAPSIGKSLWLKLDPETMQFGEVAHHFEGEADPATMTLGMKKWNWIDTIYSNGSTTVPRAQNKFTLTFTAPNRFSAATDCNGVGGEYATNGSKISFTKMMSTLMYCEGSQEADFSKALGEAESYRFTSKGELIFGLKFDSGSMIFR